MPVWILGRGGHVAGGRERAFQVDVVGRLGHDFDAQRDLDRHQLRRVDLELVVHAVAQQAVAVERDQLVLRVELEDAVSRVERFVALALDHEEAVALDGQVGGVGADFDRALA